MKFYKQATISIIALMILQGCNIDDTSDNNDGSGNTTSASMSYNGNSQNISSGTGNSKNISSQNDQNEYKQHGNNDRDNRYGNNDRDNRYGNNDRDNRYENNDRDDRDKRYGQREIKKTTAYFGDKENNRIVVVDVENMKLIDEIYTGHEKSYAAEVIKIKGQGHSKNKKLYVDNRGSDAIDVIDSSTNSIINTIDIPFHPRSMDINKHTGLVSVSGTDKPMVAIIDGRTDKLLAVAGRDEVTYPTTSGHSYVSSGTLASGHPHWLDDEHFVVIDRQAMKITTYKLVNNGDEYSAEKINEIDTPSPVHNLIPPDVHGMKGHNKNGRYFPIFYATAEGSDSAYPSVLKLYFEPNKGLSILENLEIKKDGLSKNEMGVHHLNFIKRTQKIYVGSDEGTLFVIDYSTSPMKIIKTLQAGKGAGHTAEMEHSRAGDIAIVINHKDSFITIMDTYNDTKIADVEVSKLPKDKIGKVQTQSHPKYHFSEDGRYFYMFLTEEGAFVKVDLTTYKVVDRLEIGGKIAMGSFIEEH
ncbi:MAG TPA: hypothetical protein EYO61_00775 [Campylobacterales bacterium]|nr:hypothetical protein [Campylobacterales bacterium]